MKKAITTLSVISIVFAALSFLLAIGLLLFFWEPVSLLFSPQTVVQEGPVFPVGPIVRMLCCLAVAVTVWICSRSNKGIVMEVISIILLSLILPALASGLTTIQNIAIGSYAGAYTLAALSVSNSVVSLPLGLTNIASCLCFVVCGMSISEKVNQRKRNLEAA